MADADLTFTTVDDIYRRVQRYISKVAPTIATRAQASEDDICRYGVQAEAYVLSVLRKVYTLPTDLSTLTDDTKNILAEIVEKLAGSDGIPTWYVGVERGDKEQGYSQRLRDEAERRLTKICNRELILEGLTLIPVTTDGTVTQQVSRIGVARVTPALVENPFT